MSVLGVRRAGAAALLGAAALSAAACDGEEESKRPPITSAGTSSSSSTGGGEGGTGGAGGAGGVGQGGQGGGAGGAGGGGTCGDGFAGLGEACDGADLAGQTCQSVGFDNGSLACNADCTLNTAGCSGVEQCQDGNDNDGDGAVDCNDTDCAAACADACAGAQPLPDPSFVSGDTTGHAPLAEPPSCADPSSPGAAVAYQFTATTTGFLDAELTAVSDADFTISVRTSCASVATELFCVNANAGLGAVDVLSIPVTQNDTVEVLVAGGDAAQSGPFTLHVQSHQIACGDGAQDPPEECDDANMISGDGCSAQCVLEATEVEPNDTTANANPYSALFVGAVSPAGDQDVVSVSLASGPTSLVVETTNINTAGCVNGLLDSVIEVLDPTGAVVLATDDDGGSGLCSKATVPSLPADTYFVRVKASPGGPTPTFPYRLNVTLIPDVCGDMNITPGEQCDDGNTTAGDGCSATCQLELDETEPNDTAAQANPYAYPWLATISPSLDVDVVSVSVLGPSSMLSASVGDGGTGACPANALDSYIEILGTNGTTVLAADDDGGAGYCSFATASGLAAGVYFVRVKATPTVPTATFLYSLTITAQ